MMQRFFFTFLQSEWKHERKKLFFFFLCTFIGMYVIASIGLAGSALEQGLSNQSRALLGGDISIETNSLQEEVEKNIIQILQETQAEYNEVFQTTSVIRNEKNSSLSVQVRVITGIYPLYGQIETKDGSTLNSLASNEVALESSLLERLKIKQGDTIKIGENNFIVKTIITKSPDLGVSFFRFSGNIYLSAAGWEQTKIPKIGSRITKKFLIRVPERSFDTLSNLLKTKLKNSYYRISTYQEGNSQTERIVKNLKKLSLYLGIITFVLGFLGIFLSLYNLYQAKQRTFAVYLYLGMTRKKLLLWSMASLSIIGCIGSILGVVSGAISAFLLAPLLETFLPIDVSSQIPWSQICGFIALGIIGICISFFPFIPGLWSLPPRQILLSAEKSTLLFFSWKQNLLLLSIIFIYLWGSLYSILVDWYGASLALLSIIGIFLVIASCIWLCLLFLSKYTNLLKKNYIFQYFFYFKQQTLVIFSIIIVSISCIISSLFLQKNLLDSLQINFDTKAPNVFFLDLQTSQKDAFQEKYPETLLYPIIRGRILSIDDKKVIRNENSEMGDTISRTFNLTYRDALGADETFEAGTFWAPGSNEALVSVSTEEAERFGIRLGSKMTFDIQGRQFKVTVVHFRNIEKRDGNPFFYFVFPENLLKSAPTSYFAAQRVPRDILGQRQDEVIEFFPNLTPINIDEIIQFVANTSEKASFIISGLTSFTFFMGLIILLILFDSTYASRIRQYILLKMLGMQKAALNKIFLQEFIIYSFIGGLVSIGIASISMLCVNIYLFDIPRMSIDWFAIGLVGILCSLIIALGIWQNRKIIRTPAQALFREESF